MTRMPIKVLIIHHRMMRKILSIFCVLSFICCFQQAIAQQQQPIAGQVELFCGATLDYADTNWLRLYDVQLNATPGFRWHPGRNWSLAFQGLIPVVSEGYTFRDKVNQYWRVSMATISHQLHFNEANQHFKLTAGLFGYRRYGGDLKWAWPLNSWLMLNAQAGVTASWMIGADLHGNSDFDFGRNYKFTGQLGTNVYLRPQNIEVRLAGGRYLGGDYGSQIDVMRHFSHVTLLAYAQVRFGDMKASEFDNKKYRTNGGFKIIWMLPPYKRSSQKLEVRTASNFRLTNSSRSDGQFMQTYTVDPEENEREHQVDVDWGLRKEGTR